MREVLQWLLAVRWRLALVVAGVSVFGMALPLGGGLCGYCCLTRTPRQAVETAILATFVLAVLLWIGSGQIWVPVAVALSAFLLVIALASVVRVFDSLNLALQIATVMALVAVLFWVLFLPYIPNWLQDLVDAWALMTEEAQLTFDKAGTEVALETTAPGLVVGMTFVFVIVSLLLGRYWHSLVTAPGRFGEEFRRFRLGLIAGAPATIGLVAGLIWAWPPLVNVALVCGFVFCIQGVAVAHAMVAKFGGGKAPLVVMYVLLVMVPPMVAPLISTVGLVDNWFDLRKRIESKK